MNYLTKLFDFSMLTMGGKFAMVLLISGCLGIFGIWILRGIFRTGLYAYEKCKGPVSNPVIKSLQRVFNDTVFLIAIPFSIFCSGVGITLIVGWLHI